MTHPCELWTWKNCEEKINSLPGRNGFPPEPVISFLGYNIDTVSGKITDTFSAKLVEPGSKSYRSVTHTIFYVLSAYSQAGDTEPTGEIISSKQLRGNHFLCRGYTGERVTLVKNFATHPEKLVQVARVFGGDRVDFPVGDLALRVPVLPRIPVTIILGLADEEFPAEAWIYFDATLEAFLDSEQTYFMVHLFVKRLVELAEKL